MKYQGKYLKEERIALIIASIVNIIVSVITMIVAYEWSKSMAIGKPFLFFFIVCTVVELVSYLKMLIETKNHAVEEKYSEEQFNRTCLGSTQKLLLIVLVFLVIALFIAASDDEMTVLMMLFILPLLFPILATTVAMKLAHNRLLKERENYDLQQEECDDDD